MFPFQEAEFPFQEAEVPFQEAEFLAQEPVSPIQDASSSQSREWDGPGGVPGNVAGVIRPSASVFPSRNSGA
ncbi:hypothetical protein Atai01_08830 [Amycolatopsis taiwanensis]|uniref:Uncharacterized protein n=1 Tax=Amycolatopsis taiwanensis TaxID=342230 RepID=A0A9W6QU64_9PSEU|nr:hypothetical protein Atai01_08830 [Amycolatopsis taiwanensis]